MLASPERSFGRLAAFLRLKPSAEQMARAIKSSSFEEKERQEGLHGFNERPPTAEKFFRAGTAGQWREALSPSQIKAPFFAVSATSPVYLRLRKDCGSAAK
jgi:hypothetical protein